MSLKYGSYLDAENINKIAKQHGFAVSLNLERFIMDFELHHQISQHLNCIVRGGMCVPFHMGAQRLSVDIDLITTENMKKIEETMSKIGNEFSELIINKINPGDPLPVRNLISFNVSFTSCFGNKTGVKIDFISDMDEDVSWTTSKRREIFSVPIDHEINILSHGALIGDKISTLSLNKIGVPQNTGHVPKQIFDVAGLASLATNDILLESVDNFNKLTEHKIRNYTNKPTPTKLDVLSDIDASLTSLLTKDFTITTQQNSIYGSFTSTLLGSTQGNYSKLDHTRDILLIKILAKSISQISEKNTARETAQFMYDKIRETKRLKDLKSTDAITERKLLLSSIPKSSSLNKKILQNIPLDHAYLIIKHDEIGSE